MSSIVESPLSGAKHSDVMMVCWPSRYSQVSTSGRVSVKSRPRWYGARSPPISVSSSMMALSSPTGTAVCPEPVMTSVRRGWLATRTSCPAARSAQARGTRW